ncbi:MAG: hypothetical protein U9R39_06955 [Campylobacterota bacterium]|nr:hypothetical protein [Campylobacterota bacterium]
MDLNKYIKNWSKMNFDKNSRILFLVVYAVIMFSTIISGINIFVFIFLFVITPISIYFFIKKKYFKDKK